MHADLNRRRVKLAADYSPTLRTTIHSLMGNLAGEPKEPLAFVLRQCYQGELNARRCPCDARQGRRSPPHQPEAPLPMCSALAAFSRLLNFSRRAQFLAFVFLLIFSFARWTLLNWKRNGATAGQSGSGTQNGTARSRARTGA